ncbi:hypothetical protein [Priestia taiwanensis]|uniref:Uncharacterized protein n=1 Tax=Priestia taiwanensis TaxID=1347902 RepID=A0A917ELR3_9BACI|nr:hypothetical protein [Priestia taiwanensis]MBM7361955.1 hypothetical protein [Priestia taiwanensis]GGE58343.1 hypothetical protein GCM10007140_05840 [Priestia taiwanensis]
MNSNVDYKLVYKGIHYLDLVARNTQNGGTILDIIFDKKMNNCMKIDVHTSYADGLTTTIDRLVYDNELLTTWELITSYDTHTIFSRELLDSYLSKASTISALS